MSTRQEKVKLMAELISHFRTLTTNQVIVYVHTYLTKRDERRFFDIATINANHEEIVRIAAQALVVKNESQNNIPIVLERKKMT